MSKAIAIAATRPHNPFYSAALSAKNSFQLVLDFMYGTPKRVEVTLTFMMLLLSLSMVLEATSKALLQTCPV